MQSNAPKSLDDWAREGLDRGIPTVKELSAWLRRKGVRHRDRTLRDLVRDILAAPPEPATAQVLAEPEDIPAKPAKPLRGGRIKSPDEYRPHLEGKGFVFTCAQNNTDVHPDFWKALQHFCVVNKATLGVAKITYNKGGWQKNGGVHKNMSHEDDDLWYDPCIIPFEVFQQVKIADGLLFCGELDILPTAANPLSGLDNYSGHYSAIIPHTKMQLKSLATMKHQDAKMLYTTGACTMRNYIQRRVGQIAEYQHVYGAVYVSVDDHGDWFVRQLNADDDGVFYDLDRVYGPGWDKPASDFGQPIVTLGDVHIEKLDPIAWEGASDMLEVLKPDHIFVHDLIDFEARNHHNKKDPHFLVRQQFLRDPVVRNGINKGAVFMCGLAQRFPKAKIISVRSNHDEALTRWLREYPDDPQNLPYWHKLNNVFFANLEKGIEIDVFETALRNEHPLFVSNIRYLKEDESFRLRGIEHGMHGHLGPGGSRPTPRAFRSVGYRVNTAHTHSAGIVDGVYTAGVLAYLDMGYNKGPSSWSQSHILTHPNGKRQIITQRGKKWRATRTA